MRKIPIAELVLDFDFYPRAEVNSQHVTYMCAAINAGAELPPLIAEKKTLRVVDGFHRVRAYGRVHGEDYKAAVIEKVYESEADLFLDAARYNSSHGRILTQFDQTHCILKAERLSIETEQLASALQITIDAVGKLRSGSTGVLLNVGDVPLKRTIRHMAGRTLTKPQMEANGKLSGMNQMFYVNQLIMILENGLLDAENENLLAALGRLNTLLTGQKIAA